MHPRSRSPYSHPGLLRHLFGLFLVWSVPILGGSTLIAQSKDSSTPVTYRLNPASTFQRGCFAPCLCPVMLSGTPHGTFTLTPTGSDSLFKYYSVQDINWTVALPGGGDMSITGSGTYKVGGEVALQQQLQLALVVDGSPVDQFDSGLVPGGGDFPNINIKISIHGQYCYDTVIGVSASPVPLDRLYHLFQDTLYRQGCFAPCDCPLLQPLPVRGEFSLVALDKNPLFTEYAVVGLKWLIVPDPTGVNPDGLPVTGFGMYRINSGAAPQQRMTLTLKLGSDSPANFDSGLVPGGGDLSHIDIDITDTYSTCLTKQFSLDAGFVTRRTTIAIAPGAAEP
jgi:hypothetical protein